MCFTFGRHFVQVQPKDAGRAETVEENEEGRKVLEDSCIARHRERIKEVPAVGNSVERRIGQVEIGEVRR